MTIKAIETRYKGYRFRSRLEARWAVFFDTINIDWEYEPEGFELPSQRYLPDFYFPQIKSFGEVKPAHDIDEITDAVLLCKELTTHTGKDCLLLFGPPAKMGLWATCIDIDGIPDFIPLAWSGEQYWLSENRMFSWPGDEGQIPHQFDCHSYDCCDIFLRAVNAARSARFEHGEVGA